jgi:hypothetical protein
VKGKAWIVVRREFLGTVTRPGWLISTFGIAAQRCAFTMLDSGLM